MNYLINNIYVICHMLVEKKKQIEWPILRKTSLYKLRVIDIMCDWLVYTKSFRFSLKSQPNLPLLSRLIVLYRISFRYMILLLLDLVILKRSLESQYRLTKFRTPCSHTFT